MHTISLLLSNSFGAVEPDRWSTVLDPFLSPVAIAITVLGVAVIAWGVARGAIMLIAMEARSLKGTPPAEDRARLRAHLGYYLLLGLEFIVAADIVETFLTPNWQHVAVLGGIVLIRTVISFSLSWELKTGDLRG